MGLLDKYPTVKKCCFCCNLKIGTVIIAILSMFYWPSSFEVCGKDTFIGKVAFVVLILMLIAGIQLFIASILLLVGVLVTNKSWTATVYIFSVFGALATSTVWLLVSLINSKVNEECKNVIIITETLKLTILYVSFGTILTILMWLYFTVVVNSYRVESMA